jgi:hypothetical protein
LTRVFDRGLTRVFDSAWSLLADLEPARRPGVRADHAAWAGRSWYVGATGLFTVALPVQLEAGPLAHMLLVSALTLLP